MQEERRIGMKITPDDGPVVARVRRLVAPIASDLGLDLYDVEQRGDTLRVTLDTPPGSASGVDLDTLALATRLVSRDLDHDDPLPGHYTLEVTSPGVERSLRTPAHFQRELGKTLNVRLADVGNEQRRLEGVLVAADDSSATIQVADPDTGAPVTRVVAYDQIDRAKTVFVWGPQPKPGGSKRRDTTPGSARTKQPERAKPERAKPERASREKQSS
jgi:ribosome maturation factor RimP